MSGTSQDDTNSGADTTKVKRCGCKAGCKAICGCKKSGIGCTDNCNCKGNCQNSFNGMNSMKRTMSGEIFNGTGEETDNKENQTEDLNQTPKKMK